MSKDEKIAIVKNMNTASIQGLLDSLEFGDEVNQAFSNVGGALLFNLFSCEIGEIKEELAKRKLHGFIQKDLILRLKPIILGEAELPSLSTRKRSRESDGYG